MKKLVIASLIGLTAFGAQAHDFREGHGYWRHEGGGGWGWVAPAVIGGAVVYAATRPAVVYSQPQPVIVQQPPVVVQQQENCSPWTEIRNPDGTTTITRTCR